MADLTSVIRITGQLQGRTIAVTSTAVISDIDDAFHVTSQASRGLQPNYTNFEYDYPSYLLFVNRSKAGEFVVRMTDTTASVTLGANMHPQEFCVMCPDTGLGVFNLSSTATTTTYLDIDTIQVRGNQTYIRATDGVLLLAFKPVT
jgi:hypothetical protein